MEMEMLAVPQTMRASDVIVFISLWTVSFYNYWLDIVTKLTCLVIYIDLVGSESFERYISQFLFVKCAFAFVGAFLVDANNNKYWVIFGGIGSYFLTVVFALCMWYTRELIFAWAAMAVSSLLFVTTPVAFGLIFTQIENPVRSQVRRLVSVMEFVAILMLLGFHETISQKREHNKRYSMVTCWVIVMYCIIVMFVVLERIGKYVSPDIVKERGVFAIFKGLRDDIKDKPPKTGLSKIHVLFFMLMLLPAFSLASMESIVSNLEIGNQDPWLKRAISIAQLSVIPLAEVAVTFLPIKEVLTEKLTLGLAHILNVVALTLLVVGASTKAGFYRSAAISNVDEEFLPTLGNIVASHSSESTIMGFRNVDRRELMTVPNSKPIARQISDKAGLVVILNPTDITVTLRDDPPLSLLNNPNPTLIYNTGFHSKTGKFPSSPVKLTVSPAGPHRSPFTTNVPLEGEKTYFLILQSYERDHITQKGKMTMTTVGDKTALPEFLSEPVLIVKNTFVGSFYWEKRLTPEHEFQFATTDNVVVDTLRLPEWSEEPLWVVVPGGQLNLTVQYNGSDEELLRRLRPANLEVNIQLKSVHVVIVSINSTDSKYNMTIIEFRKGITPKTTTTTVTPNVTTTRPTTSPPRIDSSYRVMGTAFAMIGAALGLSNVGYVHFFWMESPVRLRTTLYAWFLVSKQILAWIASHIVGTKIGLVESICLLAMSIVAAIWHFVVGWYFDSRIMPDAIQRRFRATETQD